MKPPKWQSREKSNSSKTWIWITSFWYFYFIKFPSTRKDIDNVGEIIARGFIAIRSRNGLQHHISSIIVTIAEYCTGCITKDLGLAENFWNVFFVRCRPFVSFLFCGKNEFLNRYNLKIARFAAIYWQIHFILGNLNATFNHKTFLNFSQKVHPHFKIIEWLGEDTLM